MKIDHKLVKNTLYIGLNGELDSLNAAGVREKMDELIKFNIERLVIDLSSLKFMDSTGIGVLIGRYKKLTGKNVAVYLASPNNAVDKVLTLSGIYNIMPKIN